MLLYLFCIFALVQARPLLEIPETNSGSAGNESNEKSSNLVDSSQAETSSSLLAIDTTESPAELSTLQPEQGPNSTEVEEKEIETNSVVPCPNPEKTLPKRRKLLDLSKLKDLCKKQVEALARIRFLAPQNYYGQFGAQNTNQTPNSPSQTPIRRPNQGVFPPNQRNPNLAQYPPPAYLNNNYGNVPNRFGNTIPGYGTPYGYQQQQFGGYPGYGNPYGQRPIGFQGPFLQQLMGMFSLGKQPATFFQAICEALGTIGTRPPQDVGKQILNAFLPGLVTG